MTISEELVLVEQAKENIQAFDRLYDAYLDKIYRFTLAHVASIHLAEDITSQVFILAIEHLKRFDTSRGIRYGAWLYKTAHSKIIDTVKAQKRKGYFALEEVVDESEHLDYVDSQRKEDAKKKVALVLSDLKGNYQKIISLRFFSELDIPEIAEVLDMKPSQVSVQLHRALKSFKDKFHKRFPKSEIFDLI